MKMRVEVIQSGDFSGAAVKRAHRRGLVAAGTYWHQMLLPLRFKKGAEGRYGFKPRTRTYVAYKRDTGKGGPLTWTGKLREASEEARINATDRGVVVKMQNLPDYITQRRKNAAARLRIFHAMLKDGIKPSVAAAKAGLKLDRQKRSRIYKELVKPGEPWNEDAWRRATEQSLVPFSDQPNIRAEMTRTPRWEGEQIVVYYDEGAQNSLAAEPKTTRRRRVV